MIYFDNAATTRMKPKEVLEAFNYYVTEIGTSPGRGSYSLGIKRFYDAYKKGKGNELVPKGSTPPKISSLMDFCKKEIM